MSSVVSSLVRIGVKEMPRSVENKNVIAGRIALSLENWKAVTSDQIQIQVLDCVQGYRIQWRETPSQSYSPKEIVFPLRERKNLSGSRSNALQTSYLPSIDGDARVCVSIFCGPQEGRCNPADHKPEGTELFCGRSPLQNGRYPHAERNVQTRIGDFMTKVDLKDAYFTIPIRVEDRKYLRFAWQNKMFQFNCLPFGLSSAPWVFTKTSRAAVVVLRSLGSRLIIYIDDILIMAESTLKAKDHTEGLIFLLENLGFIINYPKSQLTPCKEIDFLGFTVNSETMTMCLPAEKKIKKTRSEEKKLLEQPNQPALHWYSLGSSES